MKRRVEILRDCADDEVRHKYFEEHIKSGDLFGTLATLVNIVKQEEEKFHSSENSEKIQQNIEILKRLEEDLSFLQWNYRIIKK